MVMTPFGCAGLLQEILNAVELMAVTVGVGWERGASSGVWTLATGLDPHPPAVHAFTVKRYKVKGIRPVTVAARADPLNRMVGT